MAEGLLDSNYP